jgi:hypothetical protein
MDGSGKQRTNVRHALRLLARRSANALFGERGIADAQARLAWADAQQFIYEASSPSTRIFADHWALRREALAQRPANGLLMEFGVYQARSFNYFADELIAAKDVRTLHGFDSFSGFSEEWGGVDAAYPVDHFDQQGGRPEVRSNCMLIDGFVEDTLPAFLASNDGPVAFVHIDTDTYSPARTVLEYCRPRLRAGSIVLFDELLGYTNWRSHEYRALTETLAPEEYSFLGFATSSAHARLIKAAIRIEKDLS